MNKYGNWEESLLRTIVMSICIMMVVLSINRVVVSVVCDQIALANFTAIFSDPFGYLFVLLTMSIMSLIGWVFIGIPFHYFICNWLTPKYIYYVVVATVSSTPITYLSYEERNMIPYLLAIPQVILFRYYAYREIAPSKDTNGTKSLDMPASSEG